MKNRDEKRTVLSRRRQTVLRRIHHHVKNDENHLKTHNVSISDQIGCDDSYEENNHLRKDDRHKLMKYLLKDIRHRNLECIEEILISSASRFGLPDIDPNGKLLMYSFSLHFLDVIELLLKYNSPIGCNNTCGLSVLHQAVKYQRMDTLQILLRYHVDVNQPSLYEQKTALHIAVKQNNIQLVLLLLSYGANPNKADIYGCTPLHRAASYGLNDMVSLLLEHEADINAFDRVTWTPLHHCAEMNYWKTVKLLIDNKANITAQTKYGKSALHLACYRGHYNVVQVLLNSGCPVELKDIHGNTARTYTEDSDIMTLLDTNSLDNNSLDLEYQPQTVKHIEMNLRSKSLIDLLETDYIKQDYPTSVSDKTEAKSKSMPGLSSGRLQKRKNMRKTLSKSFAKLLGRSSGKKLKEASPKDTTKEAPNTYNTMSFIDAYEISKIDEESLHQITPRDAKLGQKVPLNISSNWDSTPIKHQKNLRFQVAADVYAQDQMPPSSTPRDSKPYTPNFIHLLSHPLQPPSSTPRNSKPKQPQFTNDATCLTSNCSDFNLSTVHSISDMEISAVASTCQYSNTHLSDTTNQDAVTSSNCNAIELTNQIVDDMQKNSFLFKKLQNGVNDCMDAEHVKEDNDPVDNYISSVAKATDDCISSITEVTYALKNLKNSCENEQKLKRLKELTAFLDEWALNTVDFKVNFKNNYVLAEDMGLS